MALKGHEAPRLYTPPLRELTPQTTLGFDVIWFATEILKISLLPWQKWLFIHGLEIIGDFEADWHFRYRTVLVIVARQNGKSTMSMVLSLFFLYVLQIGLVIGTSQSVDQAEEVWEGAVDIAEADEDLKSEVEKISRVNGKKALHLTNSRRYIIQAATRKGGRGKSGDLVLMDELREHQTWDAWGAITKTTMARPNALVWSMSNAGDATSVVMRHLRMQAHKKIGDPDGICKAQGELIGEAEGDMPDDDTLALFEWSAAPGRDIWDREGWCEANPSLGYGFLTERALASAAAQDKESVFRTECLSQEVVSTVEPPFPEGAWEAGHDKLSAIADDSPLFYGVDVSSDRERASVAVCGLRADQKYHVELIAYERGIGWLIDWFRQRGDPLNPLKVAMQGRGAPVSSMLDIIDSIDGIKVVECSGPNLTGWSGRFWDAVASTKDDSDLDSVPVMHRPQAALDMAANIAVTRPLGDGAWAWDRKKSMEDISPLVAVNMAYGLATSIEKEEERVSSYETDDFMVL